MTHRFQVKVYYEDTDLAGIVYYANYLKFIERARTEWVASLGVDQVRLKAEAGIVFSRCGAWRRTICGPRSFADELVVETRLQSLGGARIVRSRWCCAGASGCSPRGDPGLF